MTTLIRNAISVRPSTIHGRGVFADKDIAPGEIIEECHLVVMSDKPSPLRDYLFNLCKPEQPDEVAKHGLVLGFGSIYNHSNKPNTHYEYDHDKFVVRFTAISAIYRDEEIFTYYGHNWFQLRNTLPCRPSIMARVKWMIRRHSYLFRAGLTLAAILCILQLVQ